MLREGIPEDAEAIERIRVSAWQAAYKNFMPKDYLSKLNPLQHVDALREKLSKENIEFSVSVAEENGVVVAFYILGKPRYEADVNCTELWALNVHPDDWRKGIGQSLTERAVNEAARLGFENIELWCIHGNIPAEATYKKAGFVPNGNKRSSSDLTGNMLHELHYTKKL
ncbi:MAG: GNAT family N-acetyltransferase [Proteobacteria bacterium]|nr:GNAT family N-acetyltransferase [Pseudomonadota bacterium]MBU4471256.1 GNAT family N-acetyltransferase [Pseudomonadota bacterium]MCG2751706.1 GNAT family N-acetyltransferase [Desulfobacteraceae bacterium]